MLLTSAVTSSLSERPTISSCCFWNKNLICTLKKVYFMVILTNFMFKIRSLARFAYWARNESSVMMMASLERCRAV